MDLKPHSRSFCGFDNFYLVESPASSQVFRGKMEVESFDEVMALIRGDLTPKRPITIKRSMGGSPRDVIWTTFATPMILHKRVIEVLRANNLSGWSTYPTIVHGGRGEVFRDFLGLVVKGRCGPIDDSLSTIGEKEYPARKSRVLKGMFFRPETWDGSDFFMSSDGGGHKFVTQASKQCFDNAKVIHVEFTPLTEVERDILD